MVPINISLGFSLHTTHPSHLGGRLLYLLVEDTKSGFYSTGERAPNDAVVELI